MSPIQFLSIFMTGVGIGVLACGLSILHSLKQRAKQLEPACPPRTPLDQDAETWAANYRKAYREALDEAEREREYAKWCAVEDSELP